jgi:Secretion system C-terminal sorting domain
MKIRLQFITIILFFSFSGLSFAHVGLIYPKGGENFNPGEQINIQWTVEIDHGANTWELYFSLDNGLSWDTLLTGIMKSQLNYKWTIPESLANTRFRILVVQNNAIGSSYTDECTEFSIGAITGINFKDAGILGFTLFPAYPNPFNNSTTISFNLAEFTNVELDIYNITGEKIENLLNQQMEPGLHKISWNADNFSSGIYLYEIKTRDHMITRKLILLK